MEELTAAIKTSANNGLIDEQLSKKILDNFDQYQDALRSYNGKSKEVVHSKGCFKRENLIDSMFSLKEVCDNMFSLMVEVIKTDSMGLSMSDKITRMMEASLNKITDKMISKVSDASITAEKVPEVDQSIEKHVVLLKDQDENADAFSPSA